MSSVAQEPAHADQQLVFVHIQKTAGTTLYTVLDKVFAPGQMSPWLSPWDFVRGDLESLASYALVRGHVAYGVYARLLPGKPAYMTFLRDPVERVLSHYAHLQRHQPDMPQTLGPGMDLEAFIFHPTACLQVTNMQTRMLTAQLDLARPSDVIGALRLQAQAARTGKNPPAEGAMETLASMAFVGITERFADSLALLTHTFGWPAVTQVRSTNVGDNKPARQQIPSHVLERIVELNQEDIKLYEYARNLFETRYRQMSRPA